MAVTPFEVEVAEHIMIRRPRPTVTSTHPGTFPMEGVAETREAPSNKGASFIFDAGRRERIKFVWGLW